MTPTQKKHFRASITKDCKAAVANEPRIHYSQARPFPYYADLGQGNASLDCSGFVANILHRAMSVVKVWIHDPLDERWTGWGNTFTMEAYLRKHGKRVTEVNGFLVGDIARWGTGSHSHTAICSKAGTAKTSEWTSHGREGGPNVVKLGYRSDLVGVWRIPELL